MSAKKCQPRRKWAIYKKGSEHREKVLIAGGNGVIGRLLAEGLISDYEVTVLDKDHFDGKASSIQADAANYEELLKKIPKDTDAILNLLAVKIKYDIMDIAEFEK